MRGVVVSHQQKCPVEGCTWSTPALSGGPAWLIYSDTSHAVAAHVHEKHPEFVWPEP